MELRLRYEDVAKEAALKSYRCSNLMDHEIEIGSQLLAAVSPSYKPPLRFLLLYGDGVACGVSVRLLDRLQFV